MLHELIAALKADWAAFEKLFQGPFAVKAPSGQVATHLAAIKAKIDVVAAHPDAQPPAPPEMPQGAPPAPPAPAAAPAVSGMPQG